MDITRIVKNVLPAIVVLVAGLFGINFVYNTYLKDGATTVVTLEPAAGEDAAMTMEEETVVAVAGDDVAVEAAPAADVAKETPAPAPAADCAAEKAAAEAATGTPDEEAAKKAAADCETAAAAPATDAAAPAEATAEDAAAEHLPVTEGDNADHAH